MEEELNQVKAQEHTLALAMDTDLLALVIHMQENLNNQVMDRDKELTSELVTVAQVALASLNQEMEMLLVCSLTLQVSKAKDFLLLMACPGEPNRAHTTETQCFLVGLMELVSFSLSPLVLDQVEK